MSQIEVMKQAANAIEKLAFEMPAPNPYTPRFVMLANELMRQAIEQAEQTGHRDFRVPDGWKLVPIEPTPEMKTAGIAVEVYQESQPEIGSLTWHEVKEIFTAMLSAAPTAPVQVERVEPVAHAIIAGALFDFMGYVTSRTERIVLSASDEVTPAIEAIRDFAKKRGLSLDDALVREWVDALPIPPTAPAQPAVPPEKFVPDPAFEGDVDEATYASGWNDCRTAMLSTAPAQPSNHTEQPLDMVKAQEPLTEQAWECNECGSQEYTSILSEHEVHELGCGKCGSSEWHLADIKGASL